MGVLDYNSYAQMQEQRQQNNQTKEYKVGFFKIGDGETKIVKIPYTTVEELMILTGAHQVKTASGKWKLVDCVKQGNDKSTCPLCQAGEKLVSKILLKLVEFPVDAQGNLTGPGKAVCWAAPKTLGEQLKGLIKIFKNETPNMVFFIKRGKGSNGFVEYKIEPDTDGFFNSANLVADFSNFADYDFEGSVYVTKTAEEMEQFLATGEFPVVEKPQQVAQQPQQVVQQPQQQVQRPAWGPQQTQVITPNFSAQPQQNSTPSPFSMGKKYY